MPTSPTAVYNNNKLVPAVDPDLARAMHVQLPASVTLARGTVLGEVTGVNELQRITLTSATGGTFKLTYAGQQTGAIAYNASAATIKTALEALSNIAVDDIIVTGGPANTTPVVVEFIATLGGAAQSPMLIDISSLTGSGVSGVVDTLRDGAAGTSGLFKAYASGNTDGSQVAKAILPYDVVTDGLGRIAIVGSSLLSGEHGEKSNSIEVWYRGSFYTAELVGLDATAIAALGRLVWGTSSAGLLQLA